MHAHTVIIGRQLNIGSDAVSSHCALAKGGNCEFMADEETSFYIQYPQRLNRYNAVSLIVHVICP